MDNLSTIKDVCDQLKVIDGLLNEASFTKSDSNLVEQIGRLLNRALELGAFDGAEYAEFRVRVGAAVNDPARVAYEAPALLELDVDPYEARLVHPPEIQKMVDMLRNPSFRKAIEDGHVKMDVPRVTTPVSNAYIRLKQGLPLIIAMLDGAAGVDDRQVPSGTRLAEYGAGSHERQIDGVTSPGSSYREEPVISTAISLGSTTAKQRLRDIKRSGASWTSYEDMSKRTGKSTTQLKRVVKEDAELDEWVSPKRQSVYAVQMFAEAADGIANDADFTNGIVLAEECDVIRERVTRHIREKHKSHEKDILNRMDGHWETLTNCKDPESMADEIADGIREEKRDSYRERVFARKKIEPPE